ERLSPAFLANAATALAAPPSCSPPSSQTPIPPARVLLDTHPPTLSWTVHALVAGHPRFDITQKQAMNFRWRWALLCFCLAWAGGCSQGAPQLAPAEPPGVPVSQPVRRVVTDYMDFTGRTDAVQAVDIRARVTGYLVEMPFKEGA